MGGGGVGQLSKKCPPAVRCGQSCGETRLVARKNVFFKPIFLLYFFVLKVPLDLRKIFLKLLILNYYFDELTPVSPHILPFTYDSSSLVSQHISQITNEVSTGNE